MQKRHKRKNIIQVQYCLITRLKLIHYTEPFKYNIVQLQDYYASAKSILGGNPNFTPD